MEQIKKILIVEDETITALVLKKGFEKSGIEVLATLTNGSDLVSFVESNRPDFILIDIQLNGTISGIEAVKLLYDKLYIPVIFMSGYSDPKIHEEVEKLQPLDFFIKPVDVDDVCKAIKKFQNNNS